ncbi:hypothetical protein GCM10010885_09660 [Alicyclobacillus cellulosilyticus]|uniref:Stage II sporulation protein R n=1 Tax=Alicyclobacillus cellulosilyticus TaxID=1003997 RepID=A0A917NI48_9BACL|nr:stage II sporulation protein R [Alicyclobacillus cellulosilyticus]GGJ02419.1 hypothetical protein GCM10010885_09660 [Alicyclobacillus cellulosilyticus]
MSGRRLLWFLAGLCLVAAVGHAFMARAQGNAWVDLAAPRAAAIPEDALRLRIIANSDRPADQAEKLKVRDAVVAAAAAWLHGVTSAAGAEAVLRAHLPQVTALADRILRRDGMPYAAEVQLGRVPFPTKVYGNRVYPAGEYEALRIVLGRGAGENWWCVLYPPLCFIDIADGDAVPNTGGFPDLPPLETITVPGADGQPRQVAVRVAALDYGEAVWKGVRAWLAGKGAGG